MTAVKRSNLVLWMVTLCLLVHRYQSFGGKDCLHLQELPSAFSTDLIGQRNILLYRNRCLVFAFIMLWDQSRTSSIVCLRFNLILSSHPHVSLLTGLSNSGFTVEMLQDCLFRLPFCCTVSLVLIILSIMWNMLEFHIDGLCLAIKITNLVIFKVFVQN
jgi:hypothetical protein